MRHASPDAAIRGPTGAFDALETGRLTWVGLTFAALGWALLIGEATIADVITHKLPRPVPPSFHDDMLDIAKCIIASGFALAIIGALQTGFGALNRFFEAVLMRSTQRSGAAERPIPVVPEPEVSVTPKKRPYRIFADGSVEVETIVGTRKFTTLAEAQDFIV